MALFEPPAAAVPPPPRRRPLWDNTRVLVAIALVAAVIFFLVRFSDQTTNPSPLLTPVVLYTLYSVDLAFLVGLSFLLGRNLFKLWMEQRREEPFARFRSKLVAALLVMTIIPAVLVLITGSEIINSSFQKWFSEPADQALEAAKNLAREYYREHQDRVTSEAKRVGAKLSRQAVAAGTVAAVQKELDAAIETLQGGIFDLYRAVRRSGGDPDAEFLASARSGSLPPDTIRVGAAADRLAARAMLSGRDETQQEELDSGAWLVRTASPLRTADNAVVGVIVASLYVSGEIKREEIRATAAFEQYQQMKVLGGPVQGAYLAFFLMVALAILVSATWFGLYMARRITRPVQLLAEGAKAIGAGQLDLRLEPEAGDEFGSLVEAFNMMAAELRTSQEKLEQSARVLAVKNEEVDARRRYIETILERVATGVISLDAGGAISTVNGAAARLLGLETDVIGQPAAAVLNRDDLRPLLPLAEAAGQRDGSGLVQEITLAREEREIHLAAAVTVLTGEGGQSEGAVLVLDDVTPLIRAQRVAAWRDVARRLAHEIKNPLTPIQLSAERLRRNFAGGPPNAKALVDECTGAIVTEVEALKHLVDEFAQFARLRGPKTVPSDLNRLVTDTLRLYGGVLQQGQLRLDPDLARELPPVRIDVEQIRQVIINLVDNAVEALGGPHAPARPDGQPPTIVVQTSHDARNGVIRLVVSDNGPGVPPADRDKLFMPYFSTKGRGSGLGLAIVRRIVAEHGGGIEVGESQPGTVFTVELPAA